MIGDRALPNGELVGDVLSAISLNPPPPGTPTLTASPGATHSATSTDPQPRTSRLGTLQKSASKEGVRQPAPVPCVQPIDTKFVIFRLDLTTSKYPAKPWMDPTHVHLCLDRSRSHCPLWQR